MLPREGVTHGLAEDPEGTSRSVPCGTARGSADGHDRDVRWSLRARERQHGERPLGGHGDGAARRSRPRDRARDEGCRRLRSDGPRPAIERHGALAERAPRPEGRAPEVAREVDRVHRDATAEEEGHALGRSTEERRTEEGPAEDRSTDERSADEGRAETKREEVAPPLVLPVAEFAR